MTFSISGPGTWDDGDTDSFVSTAVPDTTAVVNSVMGKAGTIVVTVTGDDLESGSVEIPTHFSGEADKLMVEVSDGTITATQEAEETATVTVFLVDSEGRPAMNNSGSDILFVLQYANGDDFDNDPLVDEIGLAITNGSLFIPQDEFSSGPIEIGTRDNVSGKAGVQELRAKPDLDDYDNSSPFEVTVEPHTAASIGVSFADTVNVPALNPSYSFTAQLEDAAGNTVPEADIEITLTLIQQRHAVSGDATGRPTVNGTKLSDVSDDVTAKTDNAGEATFTLVAERYAGDEFEFDVRTDTVGPVPTPFISVVNQVASSLTITFRDSLDSKNISRVTAGEPGMVKILVKDSQGNPIEDGEARIDVTFSDDAENVDSVTAPGGGTWDANTGELTDAPTDGDGYVIINFAGSKAGTFMVTAEADWTPTELKRHRSFRTVADTDADPLTMGVGVSLANGEASDELDLEENEVVELRLYNTDGFDNPVVDRNADQAVYVFSGGAAGDFQIVLSGTGGGQFRLTPTGSSIADGDTITIPEDTLYKKIYYVAGPGEDNTTISINTL